MYFGCNVVFELNLNFMESSLWTAVDPLPSTSLLPLSSPLSLHCLLIPPSLSHLLTHPHLTSSPLPPYPHPCLTSSPLPPYPHPCLTSSPSLPTPISLYPHPYLTSSPPHLPTPPLHPPSPHLLISLPPHPSLHLSPPFDFPPHPTAEVPVPGATCLSPRSPGRGAVLQAVRGPVPYQTAD